MGEGTFYLREESIFPLYSLAPRGLPPWKLISFGPFYFLPMDNFATFFLYFSLLFSIVLGGYTSPRFRHLCLQMIAKGHDKTDILLKLKFVLYLVFIIKKQNKKHFDAVLLLLFCLFLVQCLFICLFLLNYKKEWQILPKYKIWKQKSCDEEYFYVVSCSVLWRDAAVISVCVRTAVSVVLVVFIFIFALICVKL